MNMYAAINWQGRKTLVNQLQNSEIYLSNDILKHI